MPLAYAPPSPKLQLELEDVSTTAQQLSEHIRSANVLPRNFPREQLEGICRHLIGLPFGTAEGCCVPLAYARKRLPAIRREYVAQRSDAASDDKEAPPPIVRGEILDQLLKELLASVTTALDQYQVESGSEIADAVDPEAGVQNTEVPGLIDAATRAQALEQRMNGANQTIQNINTSKSQNVDSLARQYKDVEIQSGLASTEISMPVVRVSWYQPIVAQLRKMPEVIETTGRAIQVATDIATPLVTRWNEFKANAWNHLLHEIEETGKTLEQVGRKLRAARDGTTSTAKPSPAEPPQGFDLQKVHDMLINGIEPPTSWVPWIDSLNFENERIPNASLLGGLTSLRSLKMGQSYLHNYEAIGAIASLQKLNLGKLHIPNLKPLSKLANLESLNLDSTSVKDIEPLREMSALRELDLDDTRVADLSPLQHLKSLEQLWLDNTKITDLESVRGFHALGSLTVSGTAITSLEPISGKIHLYELHLRNTAVSDLSPITNLSTLRFLNIRATRIKELPALKCHALEELDAGETAIGDFSPLLQLPNLEKVSLDKTGFSDLRILKNCTVLSSINISHCPVRDLSPLANHVNMRRIVANDTAIADLKALSDLTELRVLQLNRSQVVDLGPLSSLKKLRNLYLDASNVADLSALSQLEDLEEIWLDHTAVQDLSPLAGLGKLKEIWINGTRVRDLSPLANTHALSVIKVGSEARRARLALTLGRRGHIVQTVR